ncbi:dTDP-glucose 4,6 dehydratase, NAD(P)-binding [uncultured delta proteobacterium]|uniref:dTDP-glucose 4,6-dehydratase n=1 Tax=uncultured delta proteobacterium TaxID=34034 RepID=A0A212JZL2_9DELT|nr:dTDP-glucose 4,6 dehydratase, NAD(P)-binding [uncultured delta proteobacterium]
MIPTYLVTGGAGFIGSWFVRAMRRAGKARIVNLDALTYAGNPDNLADLGNDPDYIFAHGSINDASFVAELLTKHRPDAVVHFAAESHVDRSILDPDAFIRTNVLGTGTLLGESLRYWNGLAPAKKDAFRFVHVSTDEVFGSLGPSDPPFTETTPYDPKSPYSASKAGSDHLARAFCATYGLPVLVTNCSNNYGPRQFPEKLIPLMILNALSGKPLPIYGKGENVRDWLHVEDHCEAVALVLEKGIPGETYLIGGKSERTNIELVTALCAVLDKLAPAPAGPHANGITYVTDRPGHDLRYAISPAKIERQLGWKPRHTLETGLEDTVKWYLANMDWVTRVQTGSYRQWIETNYEKR